MNLQSKNTLIIFVSVIVLFAGCFSDHRDPVAKISLSSVQLLPSVKPVIGFSLENQRGEIWTSVNFQSHWNLIFFGFTQCPDICPMELHALTELLQLADHERRADVRVVFISLDPERDSREKIAQYLSAFDKQIIGLRGTNVELAKIVHFFAADYSRRATLSRDTAIATAGAELTIPAGIDMPAEVDQDYQVEHSSRIYIVDPAGNYVGSVVPPYKPAQLWNELQMIIKR